MGRPVFALVSSPVHALHALCPMHAPAAFRCFNKQPLEPTDPAWALSVSKGITHSHVHEARESLYHERMDGWMDGWITVPHSILGTRSGQLDGSESRIG